MHTGTFQRAVSIFNDALQLPAAERSGYVDAACGDDVDLRDRVMRLLAHDDEATATHGMLGLDPTSDTATKQSRESAIGEGPGSQIGPYKLLQKIGEGGFGVVYLAEQRSPVRRQVALKIIKLGMDTRQVIARFEAERQALAMMEHPNIAKVLDGGATDTGRPYFVMELVRGVPIDEYCDTENLSTHDRLLLFVKVCNAVQHAHQKGVIHRDIKPNNVMVTLHDGVPVPKVIDFGIAKAMHRELTEKTLFTEFRQFVGTPEYMSPEQAEMSGLDIDTRSDIYSLGVLLYVLLAGVTPFDGRRLRSAGLQEIQRIIREEEPAKPSTRLSSLSPDDEPDNGETESRTSVQYIARHRRTDPHSLERQLRGDLDWIVMRTLEKDRTRRYETARALAQDIERHLDNRPVEASPPRTSYRLRKFARRHRFGLIAASIVAGVFVLGLIGTSIGLAFAIQNARDAAAAQLKAKVSMLEALEQADVARAVSAFLNEDILASIDPADLGREVTVADVLERASARVDEEFRNQPRVAATLHHTIGKSWMALGRLDAAELHVTQAHRIRTKELGAEARDTLAAAGTLAGVYLAQDRFDDAADILRIAIDTAQESLGPDDPLTLGLCTNMGIALIQAGNHAAAERLLQSTLTLAESAIGKDHELTIRTLGTLANLAWRSGRAEQALERYRETLERQQRSMPNNRPLLLTSMANIANAHLSLGQLGDAERIAREVLTERRAILGDDHPDTLTTMVNLAQVLLLSDRREEGRALLVEVIDRTSASRLDWPQHALVARSMFARHFGLEDPQRAVDVLRDILTVTESRYGPVHSETIGARTDLMTFLRQHGFEDDALQLASTHLQHLQTAASRIDADADLLNTVAWELTTIDPPSLRDPGAAIRFAERACALTEYRNAYYLDTLANAHFAAGNTDRAIEFEKRALGLIDPMDVNRSTIEATLERFQAHAANEAD